MMIPVALTMMPLLTWAWLLAALLLQSETEGLSNPGEGLSHPEEGLSRQEDGLSHPEEGLSHPEEDLNHPEEGLGHQEDGLIHPEEGPRPRGANLTVNQNNPDGDTDLPLGTTGPFMPCLHLLVVLTMTMMKISLRDLASE